MNIQSPAFYMLPKFGKVQPDSLDKVQNVPNCHTFNGKIADRQYLAYVDTRNPGVLVSFWPTLYANEPNKIYASVDFTPQGVEKEEPTFTPGKESSFQITEAYQKELIADAKEMKLLLEKQSDNQSLQVSA